MEYNVINKFNGDVNGVNFCDEQSFEYLKEFIDNLEHKFNLNIVNKKATEFLNSQLYEETESLFNTETDDYEEAHNIAMYNLQSNSEILEALLKYSDNKLEIR